MRGTGKGVTTRVPKGREEKRDSAPACVHSDAIFGVCRLRFGDVLFLRLLVGLLLAFVLPRPVPSRALGPISSVPSLPRPPSPPRCSERQPGATDAGEGDGQWRNPPPLFGPIRSPNTWHSLPDVLSLTSGESVMFGHTISPMNDGNPHRQTIVFIFQQKCTCEGRGPLPQCACGAPLVHKSERGGPQAGICFNGCGRKEIILRSNSPWGFYPFQPPDSPKGQVARVSGELPPCMTRGSPLRPLGCLT